MKLYGQHPTIEYSMNIDVLVLYPPPPHLPIEFSIDFSISIYICKIIQILSRQQKRFVFYSPFKKLYKKGQNHEILTGEFVICGGLFNSCFVLYYIVNLFSQNATIFLHFLAKISVHVRYRSKCMYCILMYCFSLKLLQGSFTLYAH